MAAELSFADFARVLERSGSYMAAVDEMLLDEMGQKVVRRARSYLGVPQTEGHGDFPPWAPLAPSTLAKKGQEAPGTPLLETGALGESLQAQKVSPITIEVGTDLVSERGEPYPKYLEEGTSEMPPRPYLHPAAIEVVEEMLPEIGEAIVAGIGGIGPWGRDL